MLLTTNTVPLSSRYGDEKAIEMLAAAGFDGIDYSVTNLENFPSDKCRAVRLVINFKVAFLITHRS